MNKYLLLLALFPLLSFSQEKIEGMVMEANPENNRLGLAGANVYWMGSPTGTVTNEEGLFSKLFTKECVSVRNL